MSLYNGKTVDQIVSNLPANIHPSHKETYLKNVARVIECQETGYNLNEVETLKYSNFLIIQMYLTGSLS